MRLQAEVGARSDWIDRYFLRLEETLTYLAEDAHYLLEHAPPNSERLYSRDDFNEPGRGPPDLAYSPLYERQVSIDYPVYKLAPGVRFEDVAPVLQRLAPLRYHFREALLGSRENRSRLAADEERRLLTEEGVRVRWAYVGLAAGVMYSYPGKGTYPDDYDPRVRPWYELSAGLDGPQWGNAYWDIQGQGVVLPCSTSIYDSEGRLYGVVGIEVTFAELHSAILSQQGSDGSNARYLLDADGRVILSSRQDELTRDTETDEPTLRLREFPIAEVTDAIRHGEGGLVEIEVDGRLMLYAFSDIGTLGWYYVEELDADTILGRAHTGQS